MTWSSFRWLRGFALDKALARRRGSVGGAVEGAMITVLGPKGGTGKTITSSNLSVALALAGKSVALVDLDLQFGDVGLALGLEPNKTIYDLAVSGGTLDADKSKVPHGISPLRALLRAGRTRRPIGTPFAGRSSGSCARGSTSSGGHPRRSRPGDCGRRRVTVSRRDVTRSLETRRLGFAGADGLSERDHIVLNAPIRMLASASDVEQLLGRAPDLRLAATGRYLAH
jgi:hypothetical protein